jgi:aminopeptidase 2
MGEEAFSQGLHNYLNRHIYNNTVTEDLWLALTEITDKPIVTLMDPWVCSSHLYKRRSLGVF